MKIISSALTVLSFSVFFISQSYSAEDNFSTIASKVYTYKKMETELKNLSDNKKTLMHLESLGKTNNNKDLYVVRLENRAVNKVKPSIMAIFAQHGNEHDTTLLAMDLIRNILNDNELTKYLNDVEVNIVPMVNPDGADFDISENKNNQFYWRKNRTNVGKNIFGVDLNRNWSFHWDENVPESMRISSTDPNSSTYKGEKPFSEKEITVIKDFLVNNKNTKIFLDYHSGFSTFSQGMVLIPFTYTENLDTNNGVKAQYKDLPENFAKEISAENSSREAFTVLQPQNQRTFLEEKFKVVVPKEQLEKALENLPKHFISPGSSIDYTFGELGIPSIGLEISLDQDFYQKYNGSDKNTFKNQINGFKYLMDYVKNN